MPRARTARRWRRWRCSAPASRTGSTRAPRRKPPTFANVDTAAEDTALIAFTSGTTGKPKGTMHFHRDVIAACACFPRSTLKASPDDLFTGSPPLAFTFGLGGLLLFPLSIGAATLLVERPAPEFLLPAIAKYRATVLFTAPTSYRAMAAEVKNHDLSSLTKCVSAGEALPAATRKLWKEATGIEMIDGIGSTEMLHIFIAHDEAHAKPGATGRPIPGYRACVMDDGGQSAAGRAGRQARGQGTDRLPLPRRRPPGELREGRLELHRRRVSRRRRRRFRLPGAHRRHDRQRRLQHRRARRSRARCCCIRRSPSAASSACPTRSAARSSRRSSC